MKWPLVWRSTMEREQRRITDYAESFRVERDVAEKQRDEARERVVRMAVEIDELHTAIAAAEKKAIQSDVRAQEWEAIARELINRGAGRPHPDRPAKPEDPITKRIREESNGDPSLAAHFRAYALKLKRQGKPDDEIVGMIGWDVVNGPEPESQ